MTNTDNLATKLGVPNIEPGTITDVNCSPNDVLSALAEHNFALTMYDRKKPLRPDVYYFRVGEQVLGVVPGIHPPFENGCTPEKRYYVRGASMSPKPNANKDGHRWV